MAAIVTIDDLPACLLTCTTTNTLFGRQVRVFRVLLGGRPKAGFFTHRFLVTNSLLAVTRIYQQSFLLSLCLSACLPVCLSACLPVCLSELMYEYATARINPI